MRRRVTVLVLAATGLLAGCQSGGSAGSTDTATPPVTASTPPAAPTTPASSAATPTTTPASTTSPPPSSTAASTTPTTAPSTAPTSAAATLTTTCDKLSVRVLPGGAVRGAEIAAVQYVNDGSRPCRITGVPTAQLLRGGKAVGQQSQPNGSRARAYTIAPGDVGESLLRDFSSCNAPLSDAVRVTVPRPDGSRRTTTEPIELRACVLRLAPVGPPA